MSPERERFLVTGAAGCIGAWTVRLLLDAGVDTVASDLSEDLRRFRLVSHGLAEEKVEFRTLDVSKTDDFAALVRDEGITHIVHLAGLQVPFCAANPPLGALVNVVGTVNLFEAARASDRRIGLVYASSASVFGSHSFFTSGLVGDASPSYPDTHYGVYKVANESSARIYSMNHGIGSIGLRPFIVYGPGRDQGMSSDPTKAMLAAAAGVPFAIKFGGNVLLTYAADCAQAFISSARAAAGSGDAICLNVPGRRIAVARLVELIESIVPEAAGLITWDPAPLKVPALLESPTLAEAIGEAPNRPLADGVAETIERFRAALGAGLLAAPTA
ncbi:MAG: NAD-dependent epimerase/dehydratase [Acidimicrobiaceae bacterium]|jgi:UDP-glucuronate 4-epimerase|nr:NAD-dependent epimerase/dehydratase [Acidimicrobiaceae bacterium]